ncbi:MAG: pyridoxal phosphate-dependent aminotransferase [bacterium]
MIKLAKRLKSLKPSPTLALDAHIKKLRASGVDVISFGVGEPDFDTPESIKKAAIKAINDGLTKYTPASGTESLKKAICEYYKKIYNVEITPKQIVVSNGAKHSLFNIALAVFNKGDEVIIPSPYWVSYPEQLALVGAKPVFIETDLKNDFKLNVNDLEKYITKKTRGIILNSPSNPTGMVYSKNELKEILRFVESKDLVLIVDEIYDRLVYGKKFVSVLNLIEGSEVLKSKVVVVNGVSKTFAMTGWRIGYTISDDYLATAMADIQSQTTSNPSSISQKAAEAALLGDDKDVEEMVKEFQERRDLIVSLLKDIKGVKLKSPEGSFYVFPDFSVYIGKKFNGIRIQNSLKLCEYLLNEARVGIVPGEAFGAKGYVRFSFATSKKNIKEGLQRVKEALYKLK